MMFIATVEPNLNAPAQTFNTQEIDGVKWKDTTDYLENNCCISQSTLKED